jgi:hypothetical protein
VHGDPVSDLAREGSRAWAAHGTNVGKSTSL